MSADAGTQARDAGEIVARMRDVTKVYRRRRGGPRGPRPASTSTSPSGDFLALMGPSGSGKSTILNLLGGLDRPTRATVDVAATELSPALRRRARARWRARHVGFVFQTFNLIPVLTALENVELPLLLTPLSPPGAARAREARSRWSWASRTACDHRPQQLSGGAGAARGHRAGHRRPTRPCSSPTSRPATSTARAPTQVLDLLARLAAEHGKTS